MLDFLIIDTGNTTLVFLSGDTVTTEAAAGSMPSHTMKREELEVGHENDLKIRAHVFTHDGVLGFVISSCF